MISLYRYRIPLHRPFRAGQSGPDRTWTQREGLILRIPTPAGEFAAEAAPLPGFSADTLDEVVNEARTLLPELKKLLEQPPDEESFRTFLNRPLFPSLSFALSSLFLQLLQHQELTEPNRAPTTTLTINGVIPRGTPDEMRQAIDERYRQGYRTLKLKSGPDPSALFTVIREAAGHHPDLIFRIDANASWPAGRAREWLKQFYSLPVEYCEEPCRYRSFTEAARLYRDSPLPIALDESLASVSDIRQALYEKACTVVILKPTRLGNLFELIDLAHSIATDPQPEWILTTTLETAIGRMAVTKLAVRIGTPGRAHGLDTGRLFRKDLLRDEPAPTRVIYQNDPWLPLFEQCKTDDLIPIP
ncbi:MAG: enolase C-terminal domain-like protein [Balneolaceae bacterium]